VTCLWLVDIDECLTLDVCDEHATCTNNNGSFTCRCNNRYYGDGFTCQRVYDVTTTSHN